MKDDEEIGFVTSGSYSPTLGKNLGLALIKAGIQPSGDWKLMFLWRTQCVHGLFPNRFTKNNTRSDKYDEK